MFTHKKLILNKYILIFINKDVYDNITKLKRDVVRLKRYLDDIDIIINNIVAYGAIFNLELNDVINYIHIVDGKYKNYDNRSTEVNLNYQYAELLGTNSGVSGNYSIKDEEYFVDVEDSFASILRYGKNYKYVIVSKK